jgi:hypothetical protein
MMYSIRFNAELIHEALPKEECELLIDKYKKRYESGTVEWPLEYQNMKIEEFSGKFILVDDKLIKNVQKKYDESLK